MLSRSEARNGNLSDVIRDFKKFISFKMTREIISGKESRKEWMLDSRRTGGKKQKKKCEHQLWQYNNHAEEVFGAKFTLSKINYIHNNPVEAGLVERAIDYPFSSAKDYAGGKSAVNVSLINLHSLM
jgi:hypothetical protein